VAYNVNLNTTSVRRANSVAFDVREAGRVIQDPKTGKPMKDADGQPKRQPGMLKSVKAIGWYIEEYGIAQISMNLTDLRTTSLHAAFEACRTCADRRGMRVTGSELVGLVPLSVLLDAGRYFLHRQQRSTGISEAEIIKIAVKSLGLDELAPFDPAQKIIEYNMAARRAAANPLLVDKTVRVFVEETASESPAPGGGSVSAAVGALGAALGTMVANLSAHKRGWDYRWAYFSEAAEEGQRLKEALLRSVDEDTAAFNSIMTAFSLPNTTPEEKAARKAAIQAATKHAIAVPLQVIRQASAVFPLLKKMVSEGNPNSVTDAAVGALCVRAAVRGALLNVEVNTTGLDDRSYAEEALREGRTLAAEAKEAEEEIIALAAQKIR
jgi:glutamate formiminotransferase/formiminotetrahydrofolate cyclodeaminase